MIPTVLKSNRQSAPEVRFRRIVEYVGRDDDEARSKGQSPLNEDDCGMFNLDADSATTEDRELIWQIMSGDAVMASRYRGDPIYHFDVSWMEDEHPTREQLEQTVRHFIDGLGFGKCQTFWAVHRDTDNDHLHIIVNKVIVDPETGEISIAEKPRFDYRELARLAREVEIEQGWEHAPGYYVAVEMQAHEKKIMTRREAADRKLWNEDWEEQKKISRKAGRVEQYLGAESFQSWVMQEPAQALHAALAQPGATWNDAHAVLAQFGVSIQTKGSGMVVTTTLDDGRVLAAKASQLGKWASKAALEKQLGSYEPLPGSPENVTQKTYQQAMRAQRAGEQQPQPEVAQTDPAPDNQSKRETRKAERAAARKALAERFENETREQKTQQKEHRQQQRAALREHHRQERTALKAKLAGQRQQLFRDAKAQHRFVTPIELALHARERAMQLEALQLQHAQARQALTQSFPKNPATWREWITQQAEQGDEAAQAALRGIRYQEQRKKLKQDNAIEGEEQEQRQKALTIARFRTEIDRRLQRVIYKSEDGTTGFVDEGQRLVVKDSRNDTMEAALRVAAAKYRNQVSITGTAQFREEAARLAARLGITVRNADLQTIVEDEKFRIKTQFQQHKPEKKIPQR